MKKQQRSWKSPIAIFLLVFVVVLAGSTFARRALARDARVDEAPAAIANWREIARAGHVSGSVTPAVTVVVFADYECVGCAAFHPMLQAAQSAMQEEVRVVTRHFPLSMHKRAIPAANAAECAAEQGRFPQMEDVLYAHQDSIGQWSWTAFATRAGVRDTITFAQCVKNERYAAAVNRDRRLAKTLKLKGTPSYIVNGELHFGAPSPAVLLQQLRDAAASARNTKIDASRKQSTSASIAVRERKWLEPLKLERTIAGQNGDDLLMPGSIATTARDEIVVFDYGAMEVRTFARDGKSLWRAGRKGSGPGEYRNVMDLDVRANGEIALLDMANRRISALSSDGRMKRTVPIKVNSSRFVAMTDTNAYALVGDDSSTMWRSVTLDGKPARHMPVPASLIASDGIVREQFTAALGDGAVVTYRWSDKIVVLAADGAVQSIIDGVEPVTLPSVKKYPAKFGKFTGAVSRVDPNATPGALSVATYGQTIFVLFAGATEQRGRIVDVYDAPTGSYSGSYLLPEVSQEIATLRDGSLVSLRMEPVPALDVWTPTILVHAHKVATATTARGLVK